MSLQEHRRNNEIRVPNVRLIDVNGEMQGVVSKIEAQRMAEDNRLDLVEIQPNSEPPVCRIMDYGKFKYEQQKKGAVAKKHQKQIETKEIQFRPVIDVHDYHTKLKHVKDFLAGGDKVRLVVRMKGRERSNPELGRSLMERLLADLGPVAQFDNNTLRMQEGQFMVLATPLPLKPGHKVKIAGGESNIVGAEVIEALVAASAQNKKKP